MNKVMVALSILISANAFGGPSGTIHTYSIDTSDIVMFSDDDSRSLETQVNESLSNLAVKKCSLENQRYDSHVFDADNANLIVKCSSGGA